MLALLSTEPPSEHRLRFPTSLLLPKPQKHTVLVTSTTFKQPCYIIHVLKMNMKYMCVYRERCLLTQ